MIIELYFFLFLVSLILIFIGYYSETDILRIVGFGFIFMLGIMLISPAFFGSVEKCESLENYTNSVYVYGQNFTGYHWDYDYDLNPSQEPDYALFHVKDYTTYENVCETQESKTFGFYIAILGILGFASVYFDYQKAKKKAEGEE